MAQGSLSSEVVVDKATECVAEGEPSGKSLAGFESEYAVQVGTRSDEHSNRLVCYKSLGKSVTRCCRKWVTRWRQGCVLAALVMQNS